jgi:endonuclease/exonuclease/phosphatase family metal-dependent hydrolase
VLTYNIQQGYTRDGQTGFHDQLALIRREDPDVIGLQESDTARIAIGNNDVVRYFGDRLAMHAYYGPSTVAGTFGIALLSRCRSRTRKRTTCTAPEDGRYRSTSHRRRKNIAFVTHLGAAADHPAGTGSTGGKRTLLMGDFNFKPTPTNTG